MPKNSASSSTSSAETAMVIDPEETGSGSGSGSTQTQTGSGNTQASPPLSAKTEEIVRGIAFKVIRQQGCDDQLKCQFSKIQSIS